MAKTTSIGEVDVKNVAKSLNMSISDKIIDEVLELYDEYEENDPTSNWSEIVENILYNIK